MFQTFREDLRQHQLSNGAGPDFSFQEAVEACFEMSLWAIAIFRFGKWVQRLRFRPARAPLMALYFCLYKISQALSGIRISLASEIGPGLVIHNFGGVIVHGRIGRNCTFVQGAQMISRSDGKARGWPTLGDNVYVSAGAKIIGNVVVGEGARISANAVVITDIPPAAIVMPPESRVILPGGLPAVAERHTAPDPAVLPASNGADPCQLRTRIIALLQQTLCPGQEFSLPDSASLLDNGLADSLKILQLADAIGASFGITVTPDELMPENLDSVTAIAGYLRHKGVSV